MGKPANYVRNKLIFDMTSDHYHNKVPWTWSSTQIKEAFKNIDMFHAKYIAKSVEKEEGAHFDVGTYYHTGIIEPHLLKKECVIFTGKVRNGKEWEKFKAANKGKAILTEREQEVGEKLIRLTQASPCAMKRVKNGDAEVSMFILLRVVNGEIFAVDQRLRLTPDGWTKVSKVPTGGTDLVGKVRADSLAKNRKSFVHDLKSMTGDACDEHAVKSIIQYYNYELSAAYYLDLFSAGLETTIEEFSWTFASKDKDVCQTYRSKQGSNMILLGRERWSKGILKIAQGIQNKWQKFDVVLDIEPHPTELLLMRRRDEDINDL